MAIYAMVNGYPTLVGYSGDAGQALAGYGATGQVQGSPYPGVAQWGGASATGGGGTGGGGGGTYSSVLDYAKDAISRSPQVASPALQQAGLSQAAQQYPTYLRNMGENMAQQSYQSQVNQGIRQGNAPNAYLQALNARNQARLGYMTQAGQAQMGVDVAGAGLLNDYQRLLLSRYGIDVGQRESDLGTYRAAMTSAMGTAGRGSSEAIGGGSDFNPYRAQENAAKAASMGGGTVTLGSSMYSGTNYKPLSTGLTFSGGY